MSETIPWVDWAGGDFMPIPAEMFVTVLLRDGSIEGPAKAREFAGSESCWKHRGSDGDIVAYSTAHASLVEENRRLREYFDAREHISRIGLLNATDADIARVRAARSALTSEQPVDGGKQGEA